MRITLLKEIPADSSLRHRWNALVMQVDRPQVFYTFEWALAVQRAYGETLHPLIYLACDEQDSLCGVAPLAVDDKARVSFLCATTGDYCDFLALPQHKAAFVAGVLAELKKLGTREITLTNLPADSDTVACLRQTSRQSAFRYYARTAYVCTQVVLEKLERRPGETKPVLSRKKMVRRFLNAMGREAPVRFDHARSWTEIQPVLTRFMQAHVARFLYTGRISNMARPERRGFLAELAKLFSDSGSVVLTRMMSGQNAFAWNYGFQFHETWFWYQPTFESDLEKYSPGFCMLSKLIEEAAETPGIKIVDLGLGAEEYKDRVANQTRKTLFVTLKSSGAQHFREIVRFNAAEIVRASPRVESSARAVLQRGRRIRERAGQEGAGTTLSWLGKRMRDLLWLEGEVFFYEGRSSAAPSPSSVRLQPLGLNEMAEATMQHFDDRSTLDYLLRSASRFKAGNAEAYGLVDAAGKFVHFAWATDFDGFFLSELNAKVDAPGPDCVMLFDCWSPAAERGHGYYSQAVELIAEQVRQKGKRPWIFCAASNAASVRGLEKAGFERRYSLVRQRVLGWQRIKGVTPSTEAAPGAEASAHV